MIRLEDVCVAAGGGTVLDEVSLTVGTGEMVVVYGPRGAGKSLLAAVAAARRMPGRGTVSVASRRVGDLQPSSLPLVHGSVAYLPPDAPLLDDESALENVMLGGAARGASVVMSETMPRRALALVGLTASADRRADALSTGARRLCALARALVGPPAALVLDDPTAGLRDGDREIVLAALGSVRADGTAVLVVTGDDALAQAAVAQGGRRVRLDGGRLLGGLPGIALVARPTEETEETPVLLRSRGSG